MPDTPPADAAFAERWNTDELPPCPVGLALLRQLTETEPRLFAMAEQAGFVDPADAELTTHPLWQTFTEHYAHCEDCNET